MVSFITKGKGSNRKVIPISKSGMSKRKFNNTPTTMKGNFRVPTLPNDPPRFSDKKFTVDLREPIPSRSQIQAIVDSDFKKTKFAESPSEELRAEKEAFELGYDRGTSFIEGSVEAIGDVRQGTKLEDLPISLEEEDLGVLKTIETKSAVENAILNNASESEREDRQSSDFAFLSKRIDDLQFGDSQDEQLNDAWDAFQEGVDEGISFGLSQVEVLKVDA